MSRTYCLSCHYPVNTCLCQWVKPIHSPLDIVILQHPLEAKHAKNTARLLALGIKNIRVIQGESAQDFADISAHGLAAPEQYAVFFPSDKSQSFEAYASQVSKQGSLGDLKTLIFIDASWRKALKVWHLNPWLHRLPCWHFDSPPENQYAIRSTQQKNSLSTLESVAYALGQLCQLDCSDLYALFHARQSDFLHH